MTFFDYYDLIDNLLGALCCAWWLQPSERSKIPAMWWTLLVLNFLFYITDLLTFHN